MKKLLLILLCLPFVSFSQYTPGNTYFDANNYIEYLSGNLPIIISVPHGGYLEPNSIPDRNCSGCVYVRDSYTQELGRNIADAIYQKTSCYPNLIINLLHRKKLDANRSIETAADSNLIAEQAWYEFHSFIDSSKQSIITKYGAGLFIDLHGHSHAIQRIELGYLISKSELQLSDSILNDNYYQDSSSINNLELININSLGFSDLLRGSNSFGTYIENKGYSAIPSYSTSAPLSNEDYFSGGYNSWRHGSINSGTIDAIQIEINADIRVNASIREDFADSITLVILDYINYHYFNTFSQVYCSYLTGTINNINKINLSNELLLITDVLGRETKPTNQPLFYIYDDGTVEKRIVIE